jgi:cyanophycinase
MQMPNPVGRFLAGLVLGGMLLMQADSLHADAPAKGTLVIIGGSERFSQREIWDEIIESAGGPGSKIAVIPAANGDPLRKGGWVVETLNQRGADAFLVPLAWVKVPNSPSEIAADPAWTARVRESSGVFFIGGSQDRITRALYTAEGAQTPMLEAIWDVYRGGGVIAGTSAGAAVMSRVMYRNAPSVLATMERGVRMGQEIDRGLGFLNENWFVDQHCLVRGRFARALVAMHDQGFRYGMGVDENTAVVIRQEKFAKVIGYRGVLILDLSQSESDDGLGKFNLSNVRLTYLDKGDLFDLETLEITPLAERMEDEILDPKSPEFHPETKHRLFFNDILANSTVADVMCKLMENLHPEAYGLAFDGERARQEAVDGFEFKFTRDEESIAWFTEMFGGDDYTVLNIRLDIRPIRISGPLYEVHGVEDRTASNAAPAEAAAEK